MDPDPHQRLITDRGDLNDGLFESVIDRPFDKQVRRAQRLLACDTHDKCLVFSAPRYFSTFDRKRRRRS